MIEFHSKAAFAFLQELVGGWYIIPVCIASVGSLNFMFVSAKGIQYLDKEFSPDKEYDDTWSIAASQRFFSYCWDYLRGKIKTERVGMRVWMWFNSISHVVMAGLMIYGCFFEIYYRMANG